MKTSNHKSELNLVQLSAIFADETKAREFLEAKRWANGRACPHCGSVDSYKLTAKPDSKSPVRDGVYKCADCRQQFTVTVGTIFEESKIPLNKWLAAIHLFVSSKKGVSSKQIERELGITYRSAWFLTHRIREAMKQEPLASMLGGEGKTVEADETYVGGKPRKGVDKSRKRGRGTKKTPVAVLVERDGNVKAKCIGNVSGKELKGFLKKCVDSNSKVITDEFKSYNGLENEFKGGHSKVVHSTGEYVNPQGEHTNTAESFNAILKRGHYGIYHKFSKQHLHRYVNEFAYRWNTRSMNDFHRMEDTITLTEGKRLKYNQPVANKSLKN